MNRQTDRTLVRQNVGQRKIERETHTERTREHKTDRHNERQTETGRRLTE